MEAHLGEKIPKLGFGLMRLPMDGGKIDVERTQEMVDRMFYTSLERTGAGYFDFYLVFLKKDCKLPAECYN